MSRWTAGAKLAASNLGGLPTSPTSTTSNGTATAANSLTEVRDAVLGDYQFTIPAGHRVLVVMTNLLFNAAGATGDTWAFRIRDGGGSSPTITSTLVAETACKTMATGSGGRRPIHFQEWWLPSAGTHTLSFFAALATDAVGGDASQFTPLSPAAETGLSASRELYVIDYGLA